MNLNDLYEMRNPRDAYQRDYDSSVDMGKRSRADVTGEEEPSGIFTVMVDGRPWKTGSSNKMFGIAERVANKYPDKKIAVKWPTGELNTVKSAKQPAVAAEDASWGMAEGTEYISIGQQMANDGITYSPEKEDELIGLIAEYMKKDGMNSKAIRYYLNYDEDFISDQLSYLPKQGVAEGSAGEELDEYIQRRRNTNYSEFPAGTRVTHVMMGDHVGKVVDAKNIPIEDRRDSGVPVQFGNRIYWMSPSGLVKDMAEGDNRSVDPAESGEYDYEGDQARDQMNTIVRATQRLNGLLDDNENMPEWVQMKVTLAADYLDTAADYIESNQEPELAEGDKIGNMDADKFDAAMARLKQLAGAGPLKTVYDPAKRVYRNVPTAVQPKK